MKYLILFCLAFLISCGNNIENEENVKNHNKEDIKTNRYIIDTIQIGKNDTTIIGKARNAKAGAILISNQNKYVYYIEGVHSWDENLYDKTVKVTGKIMIEDHGEMPDFDSLEQSYNEDIEEEIVFTEEIMPQRMYGKKYIILNPKYELVQKTNQSYSFKYLKPNLDDSCTIIQHILEEESKQEFVTYLDTKYWPEQKGILADFSYQESELKNIYPPYKDLLKGRQQNLTSMDLPKRWVPLHQYKNELVLYCSIEFNEKFLLNDSMLVEFEMGGPFTKVIQETKKTDKKYLITFYEPYPELTIHIIDKQKLITAWETKSKNGSSYRLFIPIESIPYFDIICTISYDAMVEPEHDFFEKIDVEKMLENKTRDLIF